MRNKECEVKGAEEILKIMKKCRVCYLAFQDGAYPYVVPLNFGAEMDGDMPALFFHCALSGKKLDLMRQNPLVAFAMEAGQQVKLSDVACRTSSGFESVMGTGSLLAVEGEEKMRGLKAMMKQYAAKEQEFVFQEAALAQVAVLKLAVHTISGKRNI